MAPAQDQNSSNASKKPPMGMAKVQEFGQNINMVISQLNAVQQ